MSRSLSEVPYRSLGSGAGPQDPEFQDISGAVILENGLVVVADRGSRMLIAVGSDGRAVWTQGRRGHGPGEYREVSAVAAHPSGGVGVLDAEAARITVVDRSGIVVETISLAHAVRGRPRSPVWFSDETLVLGVEVEERPVGVREGPVESTLHIVASRGGASSDTLVVLPGRETYWTTVLGLPSSVPVPFGREPGYGVVGSNLVVGPTDRGEIEVRGREGDRLRAIVPLITRIDVTDSDWEAYLRQRRDRHDGLNATMRAAWDTIASRLDPPSHHVPFGPIKVDQSGRVWVPEAHDPIALPGRWWVLAPDGTPEEVWHLRPGEEVLAADRDFIVMKSSDPLGVQSVRVYERPKPVM